MKTLKNKYIDLINRGDSKKNSDYFISGSKLSRDDWLFEMRSKWNVH